MSAFCQVCGLGLTDPESIARGMGPDCAEKYGTQSVAVARVIASYADESGNVTHPALARQVQKLRAAERAYQKGNHGPLVLKDLRRYRSAVANFQVRETRRDSLTPTGFSEDRYFGSDADAARRPLTTGEAKAAEEYDEWCRVLASTQAPLDGCEDEEPLAVSPGPYADEGNALAEAVAIAQVVKEMQEAAWNSQ